MSRRSRAKPRAALEELTVDSGRLGRNGQAVASGGAPFGSQFSARRAEMNVQRNVRCATIDYDVGRHRAGAPRRPVRGVVVALLGVLFKRLDD